MFYVLIINMLYKSSIEYDWEVRSLNLDIKDLSLVQVSETMALYSFMQLNKACEMSWFEEEWDDLKYRVFLKFINKFWLLTMDKFWDLSEKLDSDTFIKWVIDYMKENKKQSLIKRFKNRLWT